MFYHASIGVTGITSWLEKNKTRDEVLRQIVCPYINREITLWDGRLFNMASFGYITIFASDKPVDSDWPLKKTDYIKEGKTEPNYQYEWDIQKELAILGKDVTEEFYREAITFVQSGKYRELRRILTEAEKGKTAFFICTFGNTEVDHNYEFVIKPSVERYQFRIQRADEISHTRTITDAIMSAINQSRFIIADLTDERPNCYYEVGYAHAIGKPVIILAKDGTPRHFDLAAHKWTHWSDYKDLKLKLDKELQGVFTELASRAHEE
jgi:hypothetical protein